MNADPIPAGTAALLERIKTLEAMIEERDNTLEAIGCGDIDALVVTDRPGHYQLYTLQSVDQPYRVFIEQMQEGAVTLSGDGTILYANLRLANILGIPEGHATGRKLQAFLPPRDAATLGRMLDDARRVTTRAELTVCQAAGHRIAVNLSLSFLRKTDDLTLLCGVMTDISEQKSHLEKLTKANTALEQLADDLRRARLLAEHADKAKSRFLAGVTHELRTPLHGILGYAELLSLEGGLNARQTARLEVMMASGQHLLGMINAVLDMSRIEADQLELHPVEIELLGLVRVCLDVVRPDADAKGLALVLAPAAPLRVFADATRLRQVLINLLGNAVKFTPAGGVEVRLSQADDGSPVCLEVIDTGPGISEGHRARLFQTFERVNADAVAGIEGAGLGLAIAARLVHAMGGEIGYSGNPGGGSVFWLELPGSVALPDNTGAVAPLPHEHKPRLRVLVVDDEPLNRAIASGFLTIGGHDAVCVDNGAAAVEAAAAGDFDAILMDVRMPGMNGLEATRRIRALPSPRGEVRIVAVTAQAFAEQIEICRQAGMDVHVSKPFKQAALLAAVEDREVRAGGGGTFAAIPPAPVSSGAVSPGAVSPGAVSPGAVSPGAVSPGAVPPGAVPPGAVSPGAVPPGAVPPGAASIGAAPTGAALAVFDRAAFEDITFTLSAAELEENLLILAARAETLLGRLRKPDTIARAGELSEAAHQLAGGAGAFGFLAVAASARLFERAANTNPAALAGLGEQLEAAIDVAMTALRKEFPALPIAVSC
jgi:PAS domain S-box-containing protein